MGKKLNVQSLVLEITARCNMQCAHCMRGDARKEDMSDAVIDAVFEKIGTIRDLSITGGEPSMRPEIIHTIINAAYRHGTSIDSFFVATNAKRAPNKFIDALYRLWELCGGDRGNEASGIAISTDQYHGASSASAWRKIEDLCEWRGIHLEKRDNSKYIRPIGRGEHVTAYGRPSDLGRKVYYEEEYDELESITVNRHGVVLACCDYSFDECDDPDVHVANILTDDVMEKVLVWNQNR